MASSTPDLSIEHYPEMNLLEISAEGVGHYVDIAAAYLDQYYREKPRSDEILDISPETKLKQERLTQLFSSARLIRDVLDKAVPLKGVSWQVAIDHRVKWLQEHDPSVAQAS